MVTQLCNSNLASLTTINFSIYPWKLEKKEEVFASSIQKLDKSFMTSISNAILNLQSSSTTSNLLQEYRLLLMLNLIIQPVAKQSSEQSTQILNNLLSNPISLRQELMKQRKQRSSTFPPVLIMSKVQISNLHQNKLEIGSTNSVEWVSPQFPSLPTLFLMVSWNNTQTQSNSEILSSMTQQQESRWYTQVNKTKESSGY